MNDADFTLIFQSLVIIIDKIDDQYRQPIKYKWFSNNEGKYTCVAFICFNFTLLHYAAKNNTIQVLFTGT